MKPRLRLLVIEDNEDDFFLLREGITGSAEMKAELFRAARLKDALDLADAAAFDLAVIDLNLPDSVGLATFDDFQTAYPDVPVVIMTGDRDRELAYEAIQRGAQDYLFKGESSSAAIVRTIRFAVERHQLMTRLREALADVQRLRGLLPICSFCKKIRNDRGYWDRLESYLSAHAGVEFSHGICPDCGKKHYGKYYPEES